MLAAKFRFHGYGALKFLFGHGKTHRQKCFSVRIAYNDRRQHSRVSVVVSKKVLKAAPKRNLVRRRIYEIIRTHWPYIKQPYDILISVYDPNVLKMPHEELVAELHRTLAAAHIWQEIPQDHIKGS